MKKILRKLFNKKILEINRESIIELTHNDNLLFIGKLENWRVTKEKGKKTFAFIMFKQI